MRIDLDIPKQSTIKRMLEELVHFYPNFTSDPSRIVVAVNQEYQEHEYVLNVGDEVALIPPVSGGIQ